MRTGISALFGLLITIILTTCLAYAMYQTPTSTDGCRIEPYAKAIGMTVLDSLQSVCKKHGYWIAPLVESDYQHVTLDDFVDHLKSSTGIFGIASHGSAGGVAVEVFAEQSARDSAYDYYLARGYDDTEIYKADAPTPLGQRYHIGAMSLLISRCFGSCGGTQSLVYNASCQGHIYCAAWGGAREVLDYTGAVSMRTTTQTMTANRG